MRSAFFELLCNAWKFGKRDGAVCVEIACGQDLVQVRVSNQVDSEIPQPIADCLFDPGFRWTRPGHRGGTDIAGTGLGLWQAKRLVQAQGGDLTLINHGPERVTFQVELPSAKPT